MSVADPVTYNSDLIQALQTSERQVQILYQEALAQNELKDKLFNVISHDLLGPIGALRECISLATQGGFWSDAELRELMPEMKKSADAAFDLLNNLLGWIRGQLGAIGVLSERLCLGPLAQNAADWIAPAALKKGLLIEVDVESSLSVVGDAQILQIILRNLLSNAVKFSHPSGAVRLWAQNDREAEEIRITVEDRGVGMEPQALATLFTMVRDSRREGTAGERGSGLGLVFCQELAKRMDGRITVKSALGQGSVFSLVLKDTLDGELLEMEPLKERI